MKVSKYAGFALAMLSSGALATSQQSQKGSIQVADGLIGPADRGISGVGLPIANSLLLGNGTTPKIPHTMATGLINSSEFAAYAMGFYNASHSHAQVVTIEQSKTLTTEEIKKALTKEIEKGSFREKRLTAEDVKGLKFLPNQGPHDVSHGIPFDLPDDKKKIYIWKPGTIMAIDREKYNAECHIDADTGRVKLNKEQIIGSTDLKATAAAATTVKPRVKR